MVTAARFTRNALLPGVLLLALCLRLWNLSLNGWGAEYYSAAVRSMTLDWHNFFYAAFDPLGFISVDKPPVALWLQVLAVKLAGFQPLAVLMPQVLAGVASVWLLYRLVLRSFGEAAALLAGLLFALTPVWVAVNRTNNTDSCLLLVLLLAAWPLLIAAETGKRGMLLLAMAGVGLAFNVKMLAGYIVLPAFCVTYLLGAPRQWQRRIADLALGGVVVIAVSLPWAMSVQLTPPDQRPYVGSSHENSMFELIAGHNAMNRFFSPRAVLDAAPAPAATSAAANAGLPDAANEAGTAADARPAAGQLYLRLFVREPAGPLRLLHGQLAAQTAWLLPFALAGLLPGLRGQRAVTADDTTRLARIALWFWLSWAAIYWIVYSALGGIVHYYYLSTLAPALAALAAVGAVWLWRCYRGAGSLAAALPAMLIATAAWQLFVEAGAMNWRFAALWTIPEDWVFVLHTAVIGIAGLAAIGLCAARFGDLAQHNSLLLARVSAAAGAAALLLLPLAWTMSCVLLPGQGVLPSADLYRTLAAARAPAAFASVNFGRSLDTAPLVAFLEANRAGERYLLATSTTQLAAPIIIQTGQAVMARGGFHGLDAAVDPQALARMVAAGELRFAMLGDVARVSRGLGADAAGKPVADWIAAHGKPVAMSAWGGPLLTGSPRLYDLRPDLPLRELRHDAPREVRNRTYGPPASAEDNRQAGVYPQRPAAS